MTSITRILLISGVVLILGAIVVVGLILFSSQAPTPPTTPPATTPPVSVTPPVTTPVVTTPPTTPTSFPTGSTPPVTVPSQGMVTSGVITNISGGPASSSGIGSAAGTGGRCTNTGGSSSSCTPRNGERAVVIACPTRTGIECAGPQGGNVVADNLTRTVSFNDYLSNGCTIQIDIFTIGAAITDTTALRDFIVFQKDDCGGSTPPPPATPPVIPPPSTLAACGGNCIEDKDCRSGDVCSVSGKCVLQACDTDPSSCNADLCSLASAPKQCGESCSATADCATGNICGSNGLCSATICSEASSTVSCSGGCPTDTTVKCGDVCENKASCPNNHTCSQGKCVADFCLPDKCKDGCQLPATALISDEVDRLLIGLVAFVLGVLALRTNFHSKLFFAAGGRYITAGLFEGEAEKLYDEEREAAISERKQAVKSAKRVRESFEKSILEADNGKKP